MSFRINALREGIVGTIKAAVPQLRACEAIFGRFSVDDLDELSVRAPAVYVGTLSCPIEITARGQGDARLGLAAFIICEGRARDADAWAIAEGIAMLLEPAQRFGQANILSPSDIKITPILSAKLRSRGVSVISVDWSQTMTRLGADIFDDDGRLLIEFTLNDEAVNLGGQP